MPAVIAIYMPNRQPPRHMISIKTHSLVLAIRRGIPRATCIASLSIESQLGCEKTIGELLALVTFLRASVVNRVTLVAPVPCVAHAAPRTSCPSPSTLAHCGQTVVSRGAAYSWSVAIGCALGPLVPVKEISIADSAADNRQRV
jgi:hypothetical protein